MRPAVVLSGVALYSALYAAVPLLPLLERLFGAPPGGRQGRAWASLSSSSFSSPPWCLGFPWPRG